MKTTTLPMTHWPYGLVIEQSEDGILLRPKRKARESWSKGFKQKKTSDEFSDLQSLRNKFDADEWQW